MVWLQINTETRSFAGIMVRERKDQGPTGSILTRFRSVVHIC